MNTPLPSRGEIWLADLDPVRGHEQGKRPRPVIVMSDDALNHGPLTMVIVVPLTTTPTGITYHVPIVRTVNGRTMQSFIMCEQIRSISTERLIRHLDVAPSMTMAQIAIRLRPLLKL